MPQINRRSILAAGAALAAHALPRPALSQGSGGRVLRFVPHANLTSLDPVWNTANITRNHGYLVHDTLYSVADDLSAVPQMAEGHVLEDDGKRWVITLREGLRFHDGEPVRARDCVASIRRWGVRNTFGQTLMEAVAEMTAPDDRRLVIRLHRPFPLLPDALGRVNAPAFVMPERQAATDAFAAVREPVGSGPFRFLPAEWVPGAGAAYERFAGYVPRDEPARGLAGGKVARFDRIAWTVMPDSSTAAGALQAGEVDWWEQPASDLLPLLARHRAVAVEQLDHLSTLSLMRPNHLQPPFNDPAFRRALWPALSQADVMTAVVGVDRRRWSDGVGFFTPGTPMANGAGMENVTGPRSLDAAKRAIEASGYRGTKVVLLHPTDIPSLDAMTHVMADVVRRLGLPLEQASTDWGTVVQRRTRKEPVEQGGWSLFCTNTSGADCLNPAAHPQLRANGEAGWFGWPASAEMERERAAWLAAEDLPTRKRHAEAVQRAAFRDVPFYPLGQFHQPTAYRRGMTGFVRSPVPVLWNVSKTA